MNQTDVRRIEMLGMVRNFGLEYPKAFPAESPAAKIFADLSSAMQKLDTESISQFTRFGTAVDQQTKDSARSALRDVLHKFAVTAHAVAISTGVGLDATFKVPRSGDHNLLTAAKAFAKEAVPYTDAFIAHGMTAGFLDDLNARIKAFEDASDQKDTNREMRAASKYGTDAALEQGLISAIRLDAVVHNTLGDDGEAIAKWRVARRVEYPPRARRSQKPAAPSPTTPPPASSTQSAAAEPSVAGASHAA